MCFFDFFFHFVPIFLKILRLFNVIKIAVNLFMQWKECLTNGQMLARSDHYIFFHNLHEILFWPDVCKHFVHITFIRFFLQMIQQSAVVVRFSIFFQGIINIAGISNTTPGLHSFWSRKKIMIVNPHYMYAFPLYLVHSLFGLDLGRLVFKTKKGV